MRLTNDAEAPGLDADKLSELSAGPQSTTDHPLRLEDLKKFRPSRYMSFSTDSSPILWYFVVCFFAHVTSGYFSKYHQSTLAFAIYLLSILSFATCPLVLLGYAAHAVNRSTRRISKDQCSVCTYPLPRSAPDAKKDTLFRVTCTECGSTVFQEGGR